MKFITWILLEAGPYKNINQQYVMITSAKNATMFNIKSTTYEFIDYYGSLLKSQVAFKLFYFIIGSLRDYFTGQK